MKYLLDTCTVSDFVKGLPNPLARIKATPPDLIAVSALTRMEVAYGLALNKGQPIGAYNVLIAGTAVARGLVVVTSNVGEFRRVGGLQLEDWR
jgi:tRNA(fMet)-specific endonuclease VapC